MEGGATQPRARVEVVTRMYSLATLIRSFSNLTKANYSQHDVLPDYSGQRYVVAVLQYTSACRESRHGVIARGGIALFRFNFGCVFISSKHEHGAEFLECASGSYKEWESEAGSAVISPLNSAVLKLV